MMERTLWRSFGATVRGRGHVLTGMPNQDCWHSFHLPWGDGVVVSDGLGSRSNSRFGSLSACRAVEDVVRSHRNTIRSGRTTDLLPLIREQWRRRLGPIDPADAGATCLFALRVGDGKIRLGLLGDGCVVAVKDSGDVRSLVADKEDLFSNMTTALSAKTTESDWIVADVPEPQCKAVILCTDGVHDDIEDLAGFATRATESYGTLARVAASRNARDMLMKWPVPKHSDDLTIAGLVRAVIVDE